MPEKHGVSILKYNTSRRVVQNDERDLIYMSEVNNLLRHGLSQSDKELPFMEFDEKSGQLFFSNDKSIVVAFIGKELSTDIVLKADELLENVNNRIAK